MLLNCDPPTYEIEATTGMTSCGTRLKSSLILRFTEVKIIKTFLPCRIQPIWYHSRIIYISFHRRSAHEDKSTGIDDKELATTGRKLVYDMMAVHAHEMMESMALSKRALRYLKEEIDDANDQSSTLNLSELIDDLKPYDWVRNMIHWLKNKIGTEVSLYLKNSFKAWSFISCAGENFWRRNGEIKIFGELGMAKIRQKDFIHPKACFHAVFSSFFISIVIRYLKCCTR